MKPRVFADPYAPPSLLVADDEPEMIAFISDAMQAAGYRVSGFSDGAAVFKHLLQVLAGNQETPSAIVVDVKMPRMTGLEVLGAIVGCGLRIPVVLITAFGDPALHGKARALGASDVIDKPFDIARLKAALELAIRST